jgi:hypothetical protein
MNSGKATDETVVPRELRDRELTDAGSEAAQESLRSIARALSLVQAPTSSGCTSLPTSPAASGI